MKVPEPRKMSSGNYYIQLRLGGVSIPVTAPTAAECKRQAALIKAEHQTGKRQITDTSTLTLRSAIKNYINSKSNVLSPATLRGYEIIMRNRFQSVMDKPIKNIKGWQTIINNEALLCSSKTLKNAWGLVSTVIKVNGLQAPIVSLPQVVSKESKWLTPEQIPIFIDAIKDKEWAVAPLLALHSLRSSEIYGLAETQGIDIKNNVIHVRGAVVPDRSHKFIYKETNKNETSTRDVPIMIPLLVDLLNAGRSIVDRAPTNLRNRINETCRDAGLPEVGLHGLRHSFASLAYHLGWSEQYTMEIGGWADAKTMRDIYTHLANIEKQKRLNEMAAFYGAAK